MKVDEVETVDAPSGDVPQHRVRVRESLIMCHSWVRSGEIEKFMCPWSDASRTDSVFQDSGHTLRLILIHIDECQHSRHTKWKLM